jgi:hypothetical protein
MNHNAHSGQSPETIGCRNPRSALQANIVFAAFHAKASSSASQHADRIRQTAHRLKANTASSGAFSFSEISPAEESIETPLPNSLKLH